MGSEPGPMTVVGLKGEDPDSDGLAGDDPEPDSDGVDPDPVGLKGEDPDPDGEEPVGTGVAGQITSTSVVVRVVVWVA